MTLTRKSIEHILKHVYDGDDFEWSQDGHGVTMSVNHVRMLDKIKFHDTMVKVGVDKFCGG